MTAIADQSSMPPWSLPSLPALLILGVLLFLGAAALIWAERNITPITDEDTSSLDALDGVGRCEQRTCPGNGRFNVTDGEGHSRRVCSSCFERGWRMGWWVSMYDRGPYDQNAGDQR